MCIRDSYNYEDDTFTKVEKLKGISIQDIFEDMEGKIWISTFVNGLYRFDQDTKKWKIFLPVSYTHLYLLRLVLVGQMWQILLFDFGKQKPTKGVFVLR